MTRSSLLLIPVLLFGTFLFAQQKQDFNEFETLKAEGPIPADFSTRTYDKIQEDIRVGREEISQKKGEKIFIQSVNSSIDEILHSGTVIYGDEISNYVQDVAKKVLSSEPELYKKLRFYTLKSNAANALSTDQGIVFVTTGLIAQLENEAQLAYVLAHEISHYTEKHVVETFEYNMENRFSLNIERLSIYSREKEYEADRLGVKLYHEAGYSRDELTSTFDVLLYSYLPYDEVEFPNTYFNSPLLYVPANQFPDKKYEIKAEEDVDDSKSSHPNVKSRKDRAQDEAGRFANWGTEIFTLGQERFRYIRNLARFESIRTDIIDLEYADALYTIFLLEREFPNSIYLQRRKAQIWLGMSQLENAGMGSRYVDRSSDYEGEIAALHFFLKKLNKTSTATLAIRNIEDIRKKYPEDEQIRIIWERMVRSLAYNDRFKTEDFSNKTFEQASQEFLEAQVMDSTETKEETNEKLSKYEKIRRKKDLSNSDNFDSLNYYRYAITDLLDNEEFLSTYRKYEDEKDEKEKEEEAFNALSRAEQRLAEKEEAENQNYIGIRNAILFDPYTAHYKHGHVDIDKSQKYQERFNVAMENVIDQVGVDLKPVTRFNLDETGTQGFNDRSIIMTYFRQSEIMDEVDDIFPVDYSDIQELKERYQTSHIVFSLLEHSFYFSDGYPTGIILATVTPLGLIYYPVKLFSMHHSELSLIVFNLDDPLQSKAMYYYFREPLTELAIESRLFEIFNEFSKLPQK